MFRLLLWGFVFYLIYKFLFEFLVPVSKVAKDMKQKVNEMNEQQNQQQSSFQNQEHSAKPAVDDKDYIDFEEIK